MKKGSLKLFRNWKEAETFLVVLLVLTVIFSFPNRDPFLVLAVTFFVLLLSLVFTKMAGHKYGVESELTLWVIKRYYPSQSKRLPKKVLGQTIYSFPAGVFFPLLFSLFTKGFFPFSLVSSYKQVETHRMGTLRSHLMEWEHAKIIFLGLAPLIVLIPFLNALSLIVPVFIVTFFVVGQLIPLPGSNGLILLFSSPTLYVFTAALFFSMIALLQVINIILILTLAITFAVLVTGFYYYHFQLTRS